MEGAKKMKKAMIALALGWLVVSGGFAVAEEAATPAPGEEAKAQPAAPAPDAPTFGENLRDGAIGIPTAFLRAAGDLGGSLCYVFGSLSVLGADVIGLVDNNPLTEKVTSGILSNRFEELAYVFDMGAAACIEGVNAANFKLIPMDPDVHLNPAEMMHGESYKMIPLAFKSFGMMFADFGMGIWESGSRLLQAVAYADVVSQDRRDLAESAFGRILKEYAR
jgi:hypothetical protein